MVGSRTVIGLALAGALLLAAGVFAAPIAAARHHAAGTWLKLAYSPLCHQLPARSLKYLGIPLAVCARCTGLYVGGAMGLAAGFVVLPRRRPAIPVRWLAAAAIPTAVDGVLHLVSGVGLPSLARCVVALPAGAAAGWALALGLDDLTKRTGRP